MNEEKPWEEEIKNMDLKNVIRISPIDLKGIVKRAVEEEREKIIKIIDNLENPTPKDVFKWDNLEKLNFNRGRFNQHCFDVWESFRDNLKRDLVEG